VSNIRKQRMMRELVGGERVELPSVDGFLRFAGIAVMLLVIIVP
jgi:hypothetical protein